jgi:hypothetical protein
MFPLPCSFPLSLELITGYGPAALETKPDSIMAKGAAGVQGEHLCSMPFPSGRPRSSSLSFAHPQLKGEHAIISYMSFVYMCTCKFACYCFLAICYLVADEIGFQYAGWIWFRVRVRRGCNAWPDSILCVWQCQHRAAGLEIIVMAYPQN